MLCGQLGNASSMGKVCAAEDDDSARVLSDDRCKSTVELTAAPPFHRLKVQTQPFVPL